MLYLYMYMLFLNTCLKPAFEYGTELTISPSTTTRNPSGTNLSKSCAKGAFPTLGDPKLYIVTGIEDISNFSAELEFL